MGKLYFRYGAMGSSKTANLLMVHYNFLERGRRPVILKPKLDTRDGEYIVKSRIGLQAKCELIEEFTMKPDTYDAILVDEAISHHLNRWNGWPRSVISMIFRSYVMG